MLREIGKNILGILAGGYIFGEMITVYTLIACTTIPAPFPEWFRAAWLFYLITAIIAVAAVLTVVGVVSVRKIRRMSRRCRRLGMVRMNLDTGRWYCEGGRH